jgi:hypothetical protein
MPRFVSGRSCNLEKCHVDLLNKQVRYPCRLAKQNTMMVQWHMLQVQLVHITLDGSFEAQPYDNYDQCVLGIHVYSSVMKQMPQELWRN